MKDEHFQKAIEDTTRQELHTTANGQHGEEKTYVNVRKRVEARAMKVLQDISSSMSNNVLRLVQLCFSMNIFEIITVVIYFSFGLSP